MTVEPWDGSSLPDALVPANPPSDDAVSQGDDHLRLIKTVVSNFYTLYEARQLEVDAALNALEDLTEGGSVYNAGRLGGELPAYYTDAGNLASGIVPSARLSGTYGINISGLAANATNAVEAEHAAEADEALMAVDSGKLGGKTLAEIEAGQSQRVDFSTVAGVTYPYNVYINGEVVINSAVLPATLTEKRVIPFDFAMTTNLSLGSGISTSYYVIEIITLPSNAVVKELYYIAATASVTVPSSLAETGVIALPAGSTGIAIRARSANYRTSNAAKVTLGGHSSLLEIL